jgi:hypothetical protein
MLVRAGIRPAVALVVLAITWPFSSEYLPAGLLHAMTGTRGQVVESIVLVLAALWSLGLLYPAGGDRHLDGREQVVAGLGTIDTRSTVNRPRVSWTNRFAYIPALERDCWLRKPEALLMHAMGPVAHWSAWIPAAALILLITLGLALLRDGRVFSHDFMDGLGIGLSSATVIAVFSSAQFAQQLGKTRGEQALLRLTPLAGNTALLNRRLADGMTKAGLITWSMMTAILLLLAWVGGADTVGLLRQFGL